MATLKTSVNLVSTTLFPAPINFTTSVTETIAGSHSSFQTVVIAANGTATLYANVAPAGSSGVLYFYAQSLTTNVGTITLEIDRATANETASFSLITPGDVCYMPLIADDATGTTITATNNDGVNAATLYFFYGEKG